MSRPDWISAELPGGFGGIKQCDSIWISPRLCRAGNEPGYFSDEGPSILVKSKVYSSAHHCAATHSKQTQVCGLPHNLRWNVCRFNKIWQKLLHRFGWNQGKNHAMFGLISIISATAVLLSLTAPKLCKFAELSKGLFTNFNCLLSNGPNDPSMWPEGSMSLVSQGQAYNMASECCDVMPTALTTQQL